MRCTTAASAACSVAACSRPWSCCCASVSRQPPATAATAPSRRAVTASSCPCTLPARCCWNCAVSCAMPAIAACTAGCSAAPAARALSLRLRCSVWSTEAASASKAVCALWWKRSWPASSCVCSAWLWRSICAATACSVWATAGSACACCCRVCSVCSRWCASVKPRRWVAMQPSSSCPACRRSRRHSADTRPSMADAATPATEVPNARPRPFTGAASAARMVARSAVLSSACTAPCSVTTMPMKVPSMPSSTSRPTRYGVIVGPGRPWRSPSTRRRTALRSGAGTCASQADRSGGGAVRPCSPCCRPAVAWWKRRSSRPPSR